MAYDVSRVQKRARDKEYRLRKQGASREAIADVSPRKPWKEIKAMTSSQQQAYAKKLDAWNRKSHYTGVKSGNVIPTKLIDQAKHLQRKHNQFIYSERERIRGIAPGEWDKYYRNREGILAKGEDIVGLLAPIDVKKMEPPASVQVARRRIKRFEERNKHKFSYYRGLQRSAMEQILWKLDQYELAEVVHQMKNDAFDLLSSVYASWDTLKYEYNPRGEGVTFEDPYGQFRSYVERALSITQGKDMVTIQKNMERVAKKRADRGRERAKAARIL